MVPFLGLIKITGPLPREIGWCISPKCTRPRKTAHTFHHSLFFLKNVPLLPIIYVTILSDLSTVALCKYPAVVT